MSNLQKLFDNIRELFQQQFKLNGIMFERMKYLNDRIDELEKILDKNGLKNGKAE